MNCKGVKPLLSAYVDRELSSDLMQQVRTHLFDCQACHQDAEELRNLKRLICDLKPCEPPVGFESKLCASVLGERVPTRDPWSFGRMSLVWAGVAACTMAVTFVVLRVGSHSAGPTPNATNPIAFEIQRDQVSEFGADPYGAPVMTASANYGAR